MGAVTGLVRNLQLTRAPKTSPRHAPPGSGAAGSVAFPHDGRLAVSNSRILRHWAKNSEWIRGAINIRKSQVAAAEWDIVPLDKEKDYPRRMQSQILARLRMPNPANDSWRSFIEPVVEDLLTLDAGCIEKERSLNGAIAGLWPVDGAKIKVNALWDGSDPEAARYFWYPDGWREGGTFPNEDFVYMMANRRTDSAIGTPPLETLKLTIEAEMSAHEYNRRQVAGAAPDGVLNLGEGFNKTQVDQFRSYFESEVAGRGAVGFIGGSKNPSWINFRSTNRDMQFLEWQIYLVRKICVVLGLTPQDLGVTFDVNRSTAETQIQLSEDRGLRPLMTLIQEYVTQEIVWDAAYGGRDNNLAFRFTALNLKESTAKAAIYEKALAGVPWRFINEARIDEGREPIPEMEGKMIMSTPTGAVNIMDIPTVREVMDAQAKEKAQSNKPAPAKEATPDVINVAATDLAPLMESVNRLVAAQQTRDADLLEAVTKAVAPTPVTIAEGAVQVSLDQPVNVTVPEPKRRSVTRKTSFEADAKGRIIGKTETETEDADLAEQP